MIPTLLGCLFMTEIVPDPAAIAAMAAASWFAIAALVTAGQREVAAPILSRLRALVTAPEEEPATAALAETATGFWELHVERNHWAAMRSFAAAVRHLERAGDQPSIALTAGHWGGCCAKLGAFEEADRIFQGVIANVRDAPMPALITKSHAAHLRLDQGAPDAAIAGALEAMEDGRSESAGMLFIMWAWLVVGEARLVKGEIDAAEEALAHARSGTSGMLTVDTWARGLKAKLLLARGRASEAAREADAVLAVAREAGVYDVRHADLRFTRAEARMAAGEADAAREAIREARADVLAGAEKIEDPAYRQSFLERVPTHVRTLSLAREWLGGSEG